MTAPPEVTPEALREFLARHRMSRTQFAREADVKRSTLCGCLTSTEHTPRQTLAKLAAVMRRHNEAFPDAAPRSKRRHNDRFLGAYTIEAERWALVGQRGHPTLSMMATVGGVEWKLDGRRFTLVVEENRFGIAEVRILESAALQERARW